MNTEALPFKYDMQEIDSTNNLRWEWAQEAAQVHPVIAQVWKRWLTSGRPFRKGDYSLLSTAAFAIKEARKSMTIPKLALTAEDVRRRKALLKKLA